MVEKKLKLILKYCISIVLMLFGVLMMFASFSNMLIYSNFDLKKKYESKIVDVEPLFDQKVSFLITGYTYEIVLLESSQKRFIFENGNFHSREVFDQFKLSKINKNTFLICSDVRKSECVFESESHLIELKLKETPFVMSTGAVFILTVALIWFRRKIWFLLRKKT